MSSPADDDVSPEERAEYLQLLRRAEALPDVAEIAAWRAAALRRPRPGVSDAEVYADEAFLLGHLAELRKLLGQLEALIGEPAGARLPLGWVTRRARSPARLRRRSASAGPGTGSRNARHRRPAP
jgi:hypothetical protein